MDRQKSSYALPWVSTGSLTCMLYKKKIKTQRSNSLLCKAIYESLKTGSYSFRNGHKVHLRKKSFTGLINYSTMF